MPLSPMKTLKVIAAFALPAEQVAISLPGCDVRSLITQISQPYAAAALAKAISEEQPDLVVNVGTAGTPNHNVGDILVGTEFTARDLDKSYITSISAHVASECPWAAQFPSVVSGVETQEKFLVNSGDNFVLAGDPIKGDAIDMEAFAEAVVCRAFGVPFVSIKFITDVLGRNSVEAWEAKLADARAALEAYFLRVAEHFDPKIV